MRTAVLLAGILTASALLAGCVGNFAKTSEEKPADIPPGPTPAPAPFAPPAPQPMLRTSITPTNTLPAWVESGTSMDVSAATPAEGQAPFTWVWGVGPLLGTAPIAQRATGIDTGSKRPDDYMPPGDARSLTFAIPGIYQMHCHPHASFMRGNITVLDGLDAPSHYDVYIEDGPTYKDFGFSPQNLTIPKGATITFHNAGHLPHTATVLSQDPPLHVQPLKTDKGTLTLTGNGWTRVVAIVHDAHGRIGQADYPIYVAPYPANAHYNYGTKLTTGAPSQADSVPLGLAATDTKSFKLDYNGTAFVNVTFLDAPTQTLPAPDPANTCSGEWHLVQQGVTTDTLTGANGPTPSATGRVQSTTYNLLAQLRQGANCMVVEDITVVYDHTPPPVQPYVDPESLPHTH